MCYLCSVYGLLAIDALMVSVYQAIMFANVVKSVVGQVIVFRLPASSIL
jgi:hypothetical protein